MPDPESPHNDVPDSATTARDSLFHDVQLNSDGSLRKEKDLEVDPLERAPTALDDEEEDEAAGNGDGFGGDGTLEKKVSQAREWWKFRLRPAVDDEPEDWWFASTAIPLLAATLGPMANVLSIAALVTSWRENFSEASPGVDEDAISYADPSWCINLNAVSLACGFLGNFFLLFNFTRAVRYIIALPVTIILWLLATGILMAITIAMHLYAPPVQPQGLYSQGYWHAVMAAVLYLICAFMLMINMLGYSFGHYPQNFELDDEQRNLILQTMMLFFWLAAGGGIFSRVSGWSFADALYFSDVTILTVGFGDFYPPNDLARGLIFPYAVGGIIILGLVVSSIVKFAQQLGHEKVIKKHLDRRRVKTVSKSVTSSKEAEERYELEKALRKNKKKDNARPPISAPFNPTKRTIAFQPPETPDLRSMQSPKSAKSAYARSPMSPKSTLSWASSISERIAHPSRHVHHSAMARGIKRASTLRKITSKSTKLQLLRNERDRFNAMRKIQYNTKKFKKYISLTMSLVAFFIVWCVGALVFMEAEGETYFESLYFCYVSLLTIGYGDMAPRSNVGKPFFIVWSLCASPTMTILISSMGDTIVASYKQGTFSLAELTILPKRGYLRYLSQKYPRLFGWLEGWIATRRERSRLEKGFPVGPDTEDETAEAPGLLPTLEELAEEEALDEHDLANHLTAAIRDTADDLKHHNFRRYTYEEWVEFTRLIRFTQYKKTRKRSVTHQLDEEEVDEGIIEWDWIGEDSPMMADQSETEWVLDRLCESLERYMHRQVPELKKRRRYSDTRYHHRRRSRQASDAGFLPAPVSGVEGPRRRNNSIHAKPSSPRSPTLHPIPASGAGARTPPIPGTGPTHARTPSSDGADSASSDSDSETSTRYERSDSSPLPLKPRPRNINTSADTYPALTSPPIPEIDSEDEDEERTPRGGSRRPGFPSAMVSGSSHGSSHSRSARANSTWGWRRRQTLGGEGADGSGSGSRASGSRRRSSSQAGMQSLTAMRLKQR